MCAPPHQRAAEHPSLTEAIGHAEEQVLVHRQVGDKRLLLKDHEDTAFDGARVPAEMTGVAADPNDASIWLFETGGDP